MKGNTSSNIAFIMQIFITGGSLDDSKSALELARTHGKTTWELTQFKVQLSLAAMTPDWYCVHVEHDWKEAK